MSFLNDVLRRIVDDLDVIDMEQGADGVWRKPQRDLTEVKYSTIYVFDEVFGPVKPLKRYQQQHEEGAAHAPGKNLVRSPRKPSLP